MDRSRLKRILLPYIVKHTLLGLTIVSLIFIALEMFQLVGTLSTEIGRMSSVHQQQQLPTEQGKFKSN